MTDDDYVYITDDAMTVGPLDYDKMSDREIILSIRRDLDIVVALVHTTVDELKPTITQLMAHPMLKMMGVGR